MTEETKGEAKDYEEWNDEKSKKLDSMMNYLKELYREEEENVSSLDYSRFDHVDDEEEDKDEEMTENKWRIIHKPGVIVRAEPSTTSKFIGYKRFGEIIDVSHTIASLWLKLKHEPGWMLVHGEHLNLDFLIIPHDSSIP
mmetsp:Transcript_13821/g.18465  ORF Transcript_13821/g.18465 Transcript_13821/m.18465 type:complete len:140 (+) Transcript_13821:136-555(+)|eukprot:CAMPEP_0197291748 /NCGR_PEP_ID=MMETSP0890-20130614/18594_1 /TAXON_ID=44058 ORGANISM="Aureoumbra lagunensis, Strain CCMP1510" /NCGR_SAMPLE_ID=MMETSP0890 /ASSEMBLY_ACC=CAM_ASM_000533 /LENGTH=139 /DNA_ID=CAMNT_0042765069 /DNA_START=95 /DNA_END=514 /DNA_ORIENTATION=-